MINAIVAATPGGPEVLAPAEIEMPEPRPGQLLVRVAATGVNFIETYQRQGLYKVQFPFTPGAEAAGVVTALGPGAEEAGYAVGDRVATAEGRATYAQYTLIDADKALPVPEGVDLLTAAALPLQGMTAHYLVTSTFHIEPGQSALVHAGAGGVGLLLIQMLKARGARVITTVSTDAKAELAAAAGADHVIQYHDFPAQVRDLTSGAGVDVVYDGVGRDTFDGSLECLRLRGMLVLFGAASGPVPPVDVQRLNAGGSLFLTRPTIAHHLLNAAERRWRSSEVFGAVADGTLNVRIGAQFPLWEAAAAHTALEGRATTGKVLLVP
ncbi:quinone oxidoreductase [Sinomonas notoginsengisoli]|uniref:quinone oxidoreductase family protein n=1 Tax=Sinomonas notoginsengisoli TaxID=1457311 RepID=UPI001F3F8217|nr:quinone oxidoreductase [Sinomonas notoginsengisoli]